MVRKHRWVEVSSNTDAVVKVEIESRRTDVAFDVVCAFQLLLVIVDECGSPGCERRDVWFNVSLKALLLAFDDERHCDEVGFASYDAAGDCGFVGYYRG